MFLKKRDYISTDTMHLTPKYMAHRGPSTCIFKDVVQIYVVYTSSRESLVPGSETLIGHLELQTSDCRMNYQRIFMC